MHHLRPKLPVAQATEMMLHTAAWSQLRNASEVLKCPKMYEYIFCWRFLQLRATVLEEPWGIRAEAACWASNWTLS
jgi:hypothetical protein